MAVGSITSRAHMVEPGDIFEDYDGWLLLVVVYRQDCYSGSCDSRLIPLFSNVRTCNF